MRPVVRVDQMGGAADHRAERRDVYGILGCQALDAGRWRASHCPAEAMQYGGVRCFSDANGCGGVADLNSKPAAGGRSPSSEAVADPA